MTAFSLPASTITSHSLNYESGTFPATGLLVMRTTWHVRAGTAHICIIFDAIQSEFARTPMRTPSAAAAAANITLGDTSYHPAPANSKADDNVHLGWIVKVDGRAATADTVPPPKAPLFSPSVSADLTFNMRGLPPSSRTLPQRRARRGVVETFFVEQKREGQEYRSMWF